MWTFTIFRFSPCGEDAGMESIAGGEVVMEQQKKQPFYKILYVQVLFAIVCGVMLGYFEPYETKVSAARAHQNARQG